MSLWGSKNLFIGIIFFVVSSVLNIHNPPVLINVSRQESAINFNSDFLKVICFGHKKAISDIIWITTLIQSDLDHYKKRDLNNWLFLRFLAIANLDPYFYQNYYMGGQFLNVIKNDPKAAENLLSIGIKYFPDDYKLNYLLGFLYVFEFKNYKSSIPYLEKIKDNPTRPYFFDSLYTKILKQAVGDKEAYEFSLDALNRTPRDSPMYETIKYKVYTLKANIDLNCLNRSLGNCSFIDFFGERYKLENGIYKANQNLTNTKIFHNY